MIFIFNGDATAGVFGGKSALASVDQDFCGFALEDAEGVEDVFGAGAVEVEFRQRVHREIFDVAAFNARRGLTAGDRAEEEKFVDGERMRRVAAAGAVEQRDEARNSDAVAGFLAAFLLDIFARRQVHVGPAAR